MIEDISWFCFLSCSSFCVGFSGAVARCQPVSRLTGERGAAISLCPRCAAPVTFSAQVSSRYIRTDVYLLPSLSLAAEPRVRCPAERYRSLGRTDDSRRHDYRDERGAKEREGSR